MNNDSSAALSWTLVGTWQLLSREDFTRTGERRADPSLGADPFGLLFYDGRSKFATQFMKRVRDESTTKVIQTSLPNNSRAQDGYDAYFGTYTVDDIRGTVTQRLVGALTSDGAPLVRTLRWRRVG